MAEVTDGPRPAQGPIGLQAAEMTSQHFTGAEACRWPARPNSPRMAVGREKRQDYRPKAAIPGAAAKQGTGLTIIFRFSRADPRLNGVMGMI